MEFSGKTIKIFFHFIADLKKKITANLILLKNLLHLKTFNSIKKIYSLDIHYLFSKIYKFKLAMN